MPPYSSDDVGGGWVIVDPDDISTDACPLDTTPPPDTTVDATPTVVGVGIGALIVGAILGFLLKGGKA